MSNWTGPWRVANDDKDHVYAVQHLVTAELRDVHVAGMRVYADDKLEIIGDPQGFPTIGQPGRVPHPEHLGYQASCKRQRVRCQGGPRKTGGGEEHLEPVSRVLHDAPAVLHKELKALMLKEQKRALVRRYGLRL